jgi:hypothetical protein
MIGNSGWKQKSQGKDLSSNNSRLHFRSIHRLTVRIETNIPTHHKYDLELVLLALLVHVIFVVMHNNYKDDFTDISPFAKYVAVLSLLDCIHIPSPPSRSC